MQTPYAVIADPADLDDLVDRFATELVAFAGRSPETARTYAGAVRLFARWLADGQGGDPRVAGAADVRAWIVSLAERGKAQATRRVGVFALRAFYDWLGATDNPAQQVQPPPQRIVETEAYTDSEAQRILAVARAAPGVGGAFDHAVLATLRYTGLRVGELTGLQHHHVDLDHARLRVIGKRSKQRLVPIPRVLGEILVAYLDDIRPLLPDSEWVFASPRSQRTSAFHGRTSRRTVLDLSRRHGRQAGVAGRHHPHRWRHTYATTLLRASVDLHRVQRLLGHASIQTTVRYLHLVDDDLRLAVNEAFAST